MTVYIYMTVKISKIISLIFLQKSKTHNGKACKLQLCAKFIKCEIIK